MNTVRDNLIAARALIDTPEKWGKGNDSFPPTRHSGSKTDCLCAHGAVHVAMNGDWGRDAWKITDALMTALPDEWSNTPDFNDAPSTTHADILALFDRAIEAAS